MQIEVNGKSQYYSEALTLDELLSQHHLNKSMVVIELNQTVPDKGQYGQIRIAEGDSLEIVKFMGGG